MLLENTLANVLIVDKDGVEKRKLRAFSHVARTPAEVQQWVLVALEHLGDPVAFDARSCAAMKNKDVSFYLDKKRSVPFVHAVRVEPPAKRPPTRNKQQRRMLAKLEANKNKARLRGAFDALRVEDTRAAARAEKVAEELMELAPEV